MYRKEPWRRGSPPTRFLVHVPERPLEEICCSTFGSGAHVPEWVLEETSPPRPIPLRGLSSKAHSGTWSRLLQGPFRYVGSPPRPIPLHGVFSSKAHSVTWALLQGPFRYMESSPPRPIPLRGLSSKAHSVTWSFLLQGPFRYVGSPPRPIPLHGVVSSKAHSVTWSRLRNSAVKKKACKLVVSCCFPIVARPKTAVGPISRHRRNLLILPWICGRLVGRL